MTTVYLTVTQGAINSPRDVSPATSDPGATTTNITLRYELGTLHKNDVSRALEVFSQFILSTGLEQVASADIPAP